MERRADVKELDNAQPDKARSQISLFPFYYAKQLWLHPAQGGLWVEFEHRAPAFVRLDFFFFFFLFLGICTGHGNGWKPVSTMRHLLLHNWPLTAAQRNQITFRC